MSTPYFYAKDGKRQGPVKLEDLKLLAVKGDLKRQDRLWCKGMKDWAPAGEVAELFEDLPPELETEERLSPPPLPANEGHVSTKDSSQQVSQEFNSNPERQVFIAAYPIGFGLIAAALLLGSQSSEDAAGNGLSYGLLFCLGGAGLLVAIISWLKLHYRMWKLIPPELAATTPGKAIGLYFVPLFNIYWCFVTFRGLAVSANKALAAAEETKVRCNDGLALAFSIIQACLLSVANLDLILGIPVMIASYVLWILWYSDLAKAFAIIRGKTPQVKEPWASPLSSVAA